MKKSFWICVVFYCTYLSIYVARINLSIAAPILKEQAVLTTPQLGVIAGAFSVLFALGRLLSSWVSDRVSPYIMLSLGLGVCGVSNLICGALPPFPAFVVMWSFNAVAQSILWGSILRVLSAIYDVEKAKSISSYIGSSAAAGNLLGILLSSLLIQKVGVEWAFLVPGTITLLLTLPILIFVKPVKLPYIEKSIAKRTPIHKDGAIKKMMFASVAYGMMKDNISLWMAVYIFDRFGVQLEQSTAYMMLIPLLGFVGRVASPTLYRMCSGNELRLISISFMVCIAFITILVFVPSFVLLAIICLSITYMAVSIINTNMLAVFPLRYAKTNQTAFVSGILDFATYLGHGFSSICYGVLIQALGYEAMFISWALLSAMALFVIKRID